MGLRVKHHTPAAFAPGKQPVPIVGTGGWKGPKLRNISLPAGIRSPHGPVLTTCCAVYATLVEYKYLRWPSQYIWNSGNKSYFNYLNIVKVETGSFS